MPKAVSAVLLIYRWTGPRDAAGGDARQLEVLLVHPGGPYWAKKDRGAWSIPKGGASDEELGVAPPRAPGEPPALAPRGPKVKELAAQADLLAVALREVREETGLEPPGPFLPLGGVKYRNHKFVYAWATELDCDPATLTSNDFEMEWPPRSGRLQRFPEVDRAAWFTLEAAREAILPAQRRFVDDLPALLGL
jgi:predicted NUDIX family NTP pyrophosphohydrolase